jgi:hypothetical protein
MIKLNLTPVDVLNCLVNSNQDTIIIDGFECGFDSDATGVYAKDTETGDYFLCTGEYGAPITDETEWLDSPV